MIDRFSGDRGKSLLFDEVRKQKIVLGIPGAAEALVEVGTLSAVRQGEALIEQAASDNDVYFIISGTFGVVVNGKRIATRYPSDHVGEMAAISPTQKRSATLVADGDALVLKVGEEKFSEIATRYPEIWRRIAQELSRRLEQRNALIRPPNEKIRVFVISSVESLHIARAIDNAFAHDPFLTMVWSNGVFRVTNYTLESLEQELEQSDFAVAVAHPDDTTNIRDEDWPTPRDNVIFELGFFMGRLGRQRAILMEPQGTKVKLPSDLAGITSIRYRYEKGQNVAALISPACNELRDHIMALGRNI